MYSVLKRDEFVSHGETQKRQKWKKPIRKGLSDLKCVCLGSPERRTNRIAEEKTDI